jgi:hypothetical protein
MDWLILIVSLPAIIVPVVLLFGFAGCGLDTAGIPSRGDGDGPPGTGAGGPSAPPQNLSAVAKSDSVVLLTWDIEFAQMYWIVGWGDEDGGSPSNPTRNILAGPDPQGTTDTGLEEGRTYNYLVSKYNVQAQTTSSGPSNQSSATVLPKTPSDLVPTPVGLDEIKLEWHNASTAAGVEFQLEYWEAGSFQKLYRGTDTTYPHNEGLTEDTQYDYRVFSIVNGVENSVQQQDGVWSAESTVVSATTFKPAFEVSLTAANQPGFDGDYCFVQRISAVQLLAGGVKVGIKVRGAPDSNVKINSIYISQVGSGNPWNSAGDLTKVMDSLQGDSALTLPDDKPKNLDPVDYTLYTNQDLLIAFDFTATPGSAEKIAYVSESGVTLYFKPGVQQASVATRDPDYSTGPDLLYLVVTIGVS